MLDDCLQPDRALARSEELFAATRSIADVVSVLRQCARAIIGADGIAVALREGDHCVYAAEDAVEPLWRGCRFRLDVCVSGWAMLNDATAIVPDVYFDDRVPITAYATKAICSLVMVPIGAPEPVAALGAYWCALVDLDAATVLRAEALARQATRALTRMRAPVPAEPLGA